MGFLDELKSQADSLLKEKDAQHSRLTANAEMVDARMRQTFTYLNDLAKQLEIIKPPSTHTFELHGVGKFDALILKDFFADYRKRKFNDGEVLDNVTFQFRHYSPRIFTIKKDMPQQIDQCEDLFWRHNLKFQRDDVRSDDGKMRWTEFTVPVAVNADASITGDYDHARLIFKLKNFERFETATLAFYAPTFGESVLEDFGRMIVGQPNRFMAQGELLGIVG